MQRLPIRTRCSSALSSELIANSKVPQMFPTSSCRSRLKTNNYQLAPILYGPRQSTKAILREYIGGFFAGIFHHGNDYRGERYRVRTDTPTHEALSAISRAPDSRLRETVWRDTCGMETRHPKPDSDEGHYGRKNGRRRKGLGTACVHGTLSLSLQPHSSASARTGIFLVPTRCATILRAAPTSLPSAIASLSASAPLPAAISSRSS